MKTKIKYVIVIGTGIIIFGILGVQAASVVPSNGVLYSNSNSTVTTVEGALNELYAGVEHLKSIGTASASDILSGKTALIQGNEVTGTIASLAATTYTPSTSNQTIAAGKYLSGAQTIVGDADLISANIKSGANIFGVAGNANVVDTSSGDATAAQILSGKKAYVDGKLVTGTMGNYSTQTIWVNGDNGTFYDNIEHTYTSGATTNEMVVFKSNKTGYFDKNTKFLFGKKSDLAPQIASGKTLLGIEGTYTSDANATAAQILSGKTAYVNGSKITGTIASLAAKTYTPTTSNQTIAAGKYLSGAQTIAGDADLKAANIKSGVELFGVTGTYTSDANATASQILSGKTAYVNGSKITGTIASLAAKTYTPGTSNQTIAAGKYLSGAQTIKGDADLKAANIKSGVEIFGVTGTAKLVTTLKSWTPNYGNWVNSSSLNTTDTYNVSATQLYILVRAENGGSVAQYSSPSCSDGTVTLLVNNGNGVLYQVNKTASATITLGVQITRNYASYPDATLKVYAIPY